MTDANILGPLGPLSFLFSLFLAELVSVLPIESFTHQRNGESNTIEAG